MWKILYSVSYFHLFSCFTFSLRKYLIIVTIQIRAVKRDFKMNASVKRACKKYYICLHRDRSDCLYWWSAYCLSENIWPFAVILLVWLWFTGADSVDEFRQTTDIFVFISLSYRRNIYQKESLQQSSRRQDHIEQATPRLLKLDIIYIVYHQSM